MAGEQRRRRRREGCGRKVVRVMLLRVSICGGHAVGGPFAAASAAWYCALWSHRSASPASSRPSEPVRAVAILHYRVRARCTRSGVSKAQSPEKTVAREDARADRRECGNRGMIELHTSRIHREQRQKQHASLQRPAVQTRSRPPSCFICGSLGLSQRRDRWSRDTVNS